ncbi:MAG: nickel-dependent lactate racemase [Methanomassiliicoccales archaeon]|nr:nickel-dependent lactate racemase [Methanomassiliicoccales archaeon]
MRLEIPFGKEEVQHLEVPKRNLIQVVRPNDVSFDEDAKAINQGLDRPLGGESVESLFEGEVLVIVNDGTRPTPTATVLQELDKRVDLEKAQFLVATGAHRAPTEEEFSLIFGKMLGRLRPRVHVHDSHRSKTEYLGRSRHGTEIWVNEMVKRFDRILIITSVEPHYFAGYTGGRKSILPGVCAYSTIEDNHSLAMKPGSKVLALEGNPVHEDMVDCAKELKGKRIVGIQVVLDRNQMVHKVAVGELHASFERAVRWANKVYVVPIKRKADVVITIAPYPMDVDLYQSQKAMENAKYALNDGGTLILVSKCRHGIGEGPFYEALKSMGDPTKAQRDMETEYRLGDHKAVRMAEIAKRSRICGVTSLDPTDLEQINIHPYASAQAALDDALARDPEASVIVIYEGSVVVPKVS